MKRINLLIVLIICLLGCTKDERQIQGVWVFIDSQYYMEGTLVTGSPGFKTWTFKKDGIGYIDGDTPIEYKRIGSNLTLTEIQTGKSREYEIQELTDTRLQVFRSTPRFYIKPGDYLDAFDEILIFKRIE